MMITNLIYLFVCCGAVIHMSLKCELDSLHASEAWDEGLEWESYQFGRTVFSTSAGIEHELE